MKTLPILTVGDTVQIIAPASRCQPNELEALKKLLKSWQLNCLVDSQIFGEDLLCANSDAYRFHALKSVLENPKIKAIICVRGGYGSMRLIPDLMQLPRPHDQKLLIGMSDITALHLFFQTQWNWPVLHAALNPGKFSAASIAKVKAMIFGDIACIEWTGVALNQAAKNHDLIINTTMTGGNLCLIQASIGTPWQIDTNDQVLFIEEVGERAYRVDRLLQHLQQAGVFKPAKAVVFGDFTEGLEPDGNNLIPQVLMRFAKSLSIPVIQIQGVGHAHKNYPLPLGTKSTLDFTEHQVKLTCYR